MEQWLVLRKDGLALFSSIMDKDPTDMLFFDADFSLFRDDDDKILVCGASWLLELDFSHGSAEARQHNIQSWCNAITLTAQLSQRTREQKFGSFAPIRHPGRDQDGPHLARFLVGGRATFRKIAEGILLAKHDIFILGFWVSPHIRLVREGNPLPGGADPTLSSLLRGAADRGVRVHVLLFQESPSFVPNDSEHTEKELDYPNIFVVRHSSGWGHNKLWTHHEKIVVIDQHLAFLGGLDLCLGRYDDWRHRLGDSGDVSDRIWQDQDYSNPRISDFKEVRSAGDILDRKQQARMPWQDIHCMFLGGSARDVARHCMERWNHARRQRPQYASFPTTLPERRQDYDYLDVTGLQRGGVQCGTIDEGDWPPESTEWQECTSQVLRSVSHWSAGTRTESSVHTAYCDLIQDAGHFVYIENQFFVSGMDGDEMVGNRVAEALFRRIVRAHAQKERFVVMVVLPLLPAFDGAIAPNVRSTLMSVMYWQTRTIRTLRRKLEELNVDPDQFLNIYGLRSWGMLDGNTCATEQVYVHSKVMLVDDQVSIIGSANINDRSLLGMRDSEIELILWDNDTSDSNLAGGQWQSGAATSQLRRTLFAQHLGWSEEDLDGKFSDPLSEETLHELRRVAAQNTEIYETVFGSLPSDSVRSWSDLAKRRAAGQGAGQGAGDMMRTPTQADFELLSQLQGHLVQYPVNFLIEEDITPSSLSVVGLIPDAST